MKTVSNTKDWLDDCWRYTMRRTVNGKRYTSSLLIDKYHMHYRDITAFELRNWRKQMRDFIAKENLPKFT